jgi:hypothetical protein
MTILSLLGLFLALFALAWRTRQTIIRLAPYALCALGLTLYVLAFFGGIYAIDLLLVTAGLVSLIYLVLTVRREGLLALRREMGRQLLDPYLWGCVAALVVLCLALRGEQILEWDAYNFWAPDIKSLYYRGGYAARYSNVAPNFGDYTPVFQLILWWFVHLFGAYQEQSIYFGYFIFSGLMLFSAASVFVRRFKRARAVTWLVVPFCALCVPGVCSVAWYRSVYVDPVMAILFGLLLSRMVDRDEGHPRLWRAELLLAAGCLALMKGMGLFWALLAAVFYLIWYREKREWHVALALAAFPAGLWELWSLYCRLLDRSGYLSSSFSDRFAQRVSELADGTFFTLRLNRGYIRSYVTAFFATPVHRESTFAIDLSPFAVVVLLVAAAVLLWVFGAIPQGKIRRLIIYMLSALFLSYLIVSIGQLTMFYYEEQYLEPVNAVTLMTRYCEPVNTGLLMLLCTLSADVSAQPRRLRAGRRWLLSAVAAAVLVSCTGYVSAYRRFVYDELDESRLEKRQSFLTAYQDFLTAIQAVPYREENSRVLLVVVDAETNPIVINAASPVSIAYARLNQGGGADYDTLLTELERSHSGYVYFQECPEDLLSRLGGELGTLYRVEELELPEA